MSKSDYDMAYTLELSRNCSRVILNVKITCSDVIRKDDSKSRWNFQYPLSYQYSWSYSSNSCKESDHVGGTYGRLTIHAEDIFQASCATKTASSIEKFYLGESPNKMYYGDDPRVLLAWLNKHAVHTVLDRRFDSDNIRVEKVVNPSWHLYVAKVNGQTEWQFKAVAEDENHARGDIIKLMLQDDDECKINYNTKVNENNERPENERVVINPPESISRKWIASEMEIFDASKEYYYNAPDTRTLKEILDMIDRPLSSDWLESIVYV